MRNVLVSWPAMFCGVRPTNVDVDQREGVALHWSTRGGGSAAGENEEVAGLQRRTRQVPEKGHGAMGGNFERPEARQGILDLLEGGGRGGPSMSVSQSGASVCDGEVTEGVWR